MAEVVHFLMISAFLVSLLLPAGQACGTASGGVANKALLHFNLSPPPKYTYSDLPRHGQMTTAQAAESNADRDLQLAILSTLAENGIMAETVKLAYQYAAPKLYLAQGNHCTEPDTYVVYDGAILYKCVAAVSRGKRSRVKREGEETDPPTEGTTETAESTSETTEISTTVTTETETTTDSSETTTASETTVEGVETTTSPETKTDEPTTTVPEETTAAEPETTTTAVEVETVQFQITGAVTVETPQPIFESQWRMFAEKIQEKLEEQRVFFTGAVMVEMF